MCDESLVDENGEINDKQVDFICHNCGENITNNNEYCPKCGVKLNRVNFKYCVNLHYGVE